MLRLIKGFQFSFLLFLVFALFSRCTVKDTYTSTCVPLDSIATFELVEGKTIAFPLDSLTDPNSTCIQYYKDPQGKNILALMNQVDHSIYLYNFDTHELLNKIQLQKHGENTIGEVLNGFYIHTLDSVFIISRYDLSLVGMDGVPYYRFSFKTENTFDFTSLPQISTTAPAKFENGILRMNSFPDKDPFVKSTFSGKQCAILLDLKKREFLYDVEYPSNYRSGIYGPNFMKVSHCYNNLGKDIYSFPIEECIYSIADSEISTSYAGSYHLPKLSPMEKLESQYETYTRFYLQSPSYSSIYFNSSQNVYYRFADFPRSDQEFLEGKVWKKKSIIILDGDFKKLGETKIDEYLASTMCFNTSDGLFIARDSPSEDTLFFTNLSLRAKQNISYEHQ